MDEIGESINKKNSILLSRNTPVGLVVGAAGFLGSHLVDALLEKGIQVIGIDDLKAGLKRNLEQASEKRNFHMLIESPDKLNIGLERLDYIFIIPQKYWDLEKVFELFKQRQSKCLLVSSIDLYERNEEQDFRELQFLEKKIAKFAEAHHLNARILRLGPIFGPRMDFKTKDPLIKLIQQALTGDLNSGVSLEFSSRALYCQDAVDLIIRTIFAGATSQKIFDGVMPAPVKVAEIKQVLMDPVWYESRGFTPTELPPWPTPNLEKSLKSLNWQPKSKLVSSLRETMNYFKDNEIEIPKVEEEKKAGKQPEEFSQQWNEEQKEGLEALKFKPGKPQKIKNGGKPERFFLPYHQIYLVLILAFITYALIWPLVNFGWGVWSYQTQLSEGFKNLTAGEFDKSLTNIQKAETGARSAESVLSAFEPLRKIGYFRERFETKDDLVNLSMLSISSVKSATRGTQALMEGIKATTGELTASSSGYFNTAQVELASSNTDLAKMQTLLGSNNLDKSLPAPFARKFSSLLTKLNQMSSLVEQARALSVLLPSLVGIDGGSKSYLILLQNNMELRPTGGFIGSFAKVTFTGGKLQKLDVNDVYAIDGQLGIQVEPPKEIKEDLGQKFWYLRDSNWEPDFPTSARQAEWFFTKETGDQVVGVIALDVSAIEEILSIIGPLNLADYKEKITSENLFERAITYAEVGFFPGSQAKKSFLTALTNEMFNKLFFLPQNNWPGIIAALGRSFDEKHIGIYLNDPKLFSYLTSQNWTQTFPRQSSGEQKQDFLSLVEANLGANKVNYYLDRNYKLETVVGKEGEIRHRLRLSYTNRSPSDAFPAGKYKNRMRVYLPMGSKLTRALWGETEITKQVTSFSDYGRAGYSMLLELSPREQKTLVLDYAVPVKLEFEGNLAKYRLDIIKQMGTLKDPLEWSISYPISYQLVSDQVKKIGPQETSISTDLSRDRSFEVEFKK